MRKSEQCQWGEEHARLRDDPSGGLEGENVAHWRGRLWGRR